MLQVVVLKNPLATPSRTASLTMSLNPLLSTVYLLLYFFDLEALIIAVLQSNAKYFVLEIVKVTHCCCFLLLFHSISLFPFLFRLFYFQEGFAFAFAFTFIFILFLSSSTVKSNLFNHL